MKLGILLSGGKDSLYAAYLASKDHELSCSITIQSENKESYMFHTPNINLVGIQSEAMNIPLILRTTKGEKEKELEDLKIAIIEAKEKYGIKGIVTGAVASQYQASRVQQICHDLDLWCFNPLWQVNQMQLLNDLLDEEFETKIIGVYGYPLDESFLGKTIDSEMIKKLGEMQTKFQINPAGEGGETESLVVDCPLFKKKIEITTSKQEWENYAGTYTILETKLVDKKENTVRPKSFFEKSFNEKEKTQNYSIEESEVIIISTVSEKIPLFDYEFIRPIVDILNETNKKYTILKISELNEKTSEKIKGKKIIISGTALKDNDFFENKNNTKWIFDEENKLFGICAGMELIGKEVGAKLIKGEEIGPFRVTENKKESEGTIFENEHEKKQFFLHQYGFSTYENKLKNNTNNTDNENNANTNNNQQDNNNMRICLTSSDYIAAFKVNGKEWYGTQFHPELNNKELLKKFILN